MPPSAPSTAPSGSEFVFSANHGTGGADTQPSRAAGTSHRQQRWESTAGAADMRPVILHLDPLASELHDTKQITSALVQWLRYELQRETGAEITSDAAQAAVDVVRVRPP